MAGEWEPARADAARRTAMPDAQHDHDADKRQFEEQPAAKRRAVEFRAQEIRWPHASDPQVERPGQRKHSETNPRDAFEPRNAVMFPAQVIAARMCRQTEAR